MVGTARQGRASLYVVVRDQSEPGSIAWSPAILFVPKKCRVQYISQTKQNSLLLLLGQHISTPTKSSSGPTRIRSRLNYS
jgi:hypothetical protein